MTLGVILITSYNYIFKVLGILLITIIRVMSVFIKWDSFFTLIFLLIYVGGVIVLLLYVVRSASNFNEKLPKNSIIFFTFELFLYSHLSLQTIRSRGILINPVLLILLG